jgi:hypothetical protein
MRIDKRGSTEEQIVAARTPETLKVKTATDEPCQPCSREKRARVLRHVLVKNIRGDDNEQAAGNIAKNKKPE